MGMAQQSLLATMQKTAALASSGIITKPNTMMPIGTAFAGTQPVSFSQVLNSAIGNVNALQHSASLKQKAIDMGQSDDLSGAIIESQKASVAFSAMMQTRNKLSSALDEVINIPL
ncbi:flagellar hook-basal body protein FliE [Chania multitudinisentens RB-25]|uniref:Flagellar hook-basal body complex protein FliE n=2 Tax=Chania TaxID=1745211 RepID=W0L768_9GAMM|nr:flagellar hook-basal body protein FliE [Chania multitudinisentens RB-25]